MNYKWTHLLLFAMIACVGEDIDYDFQPSVLKITNPIESIRVNETYQFTTRFTDNIGGILTADVNWRSRDQSIFSVDDNGLVSAKTIGGAYLDFSVTDTIPASDSVWISVVYHYC